MEIYDKAQARSTYYCCLHKLCVGSQELLQLYVTRPEGGEKGGEIGYRLQVCICVFSLLLYIRVGTYQVYDTRGRERLAHGTPNTATSYEYAYVVPGTWYLVPGTRVSCNDKGQDYCTSATLSYNSTMTNTLQSRTFDAMWSTSRRQSR